MNTARADATTSALLPRQRAPLSAARHTAVRERLTASIADPAWPLPPFFRADWQDEGPAELADTIARLASALPKHGSPPSRLIENQALRSRRVALPFYPGWNAVEVLIELDSELASLMALESDQHVVLVDGSSSQIHLLNQQCPIAIETHQQAEAYLRIFCGAIHADKGPFRIVASSKDLAVYARPGEAIRLAQAQERVLPITVKPGEEGSWIASAQILYSDALFATTLEIHANGGVTMIDDAPQTTGLPVVTEFIADGLRRVHQRRSSSAAKTAMHPESKRPVKYTFRNPS